MDKCRTNLKTLIYQKRRIVQRCGVLGFWGLGKELKRLQKEVGACIFICVCKWQGLFAWSACIRACVRTRRRDCACSSSWFTPVLPFVLFVCSFVDFSSNCNLRAVCGRTNACNVAELPRLKRSSKLRVRIPLCPIPWTWILKSWICSWKSKRRTTSLWIPCPASWTLYSPRTWIP